MQDFLQDGRRSFHPNELMMSKHLKEDGLFIMSVFVLRDLIL